MAPRRRVRPAQPDPEPTATPSAGSPRREGRVTVTLPRLLRERLQLTLADRGWLVANGQPQRGAEGEVLSEWLMDYARLRGWGDAPAGAPPPAAPVATQPSAPRAAAAEEDDFGFRD